MASLQPFITNIILPINCLNGNFAASCWSSYINFAGSLDIRFVSSDVVISNLALILKFSPSCLSVLAC